MSGDSGQVIEDDNQRDGCRKCGSGFNATNDDYTCECSCRECGYFFAPPPGFFACSCGDDDEENSSHRSRAGFDEDGEFDDDGGIHFADPGGVSALRAASPTNPRNQPCPDCGEEDALTPLDVACGYCCNACADRNEGGG